MPSRRPLTGSMEDYLEAIHRIGGRRTGVRVKDIAGAMEVTLPSVHGAIKALAARSLVTHARYDTVALTPEGRRIAAEVYRRHRVLRDFLILVLGIDSDAADRDACRMEHAVSPATMACLVRFLSAEARKGGRRVRA